MLTNTAIDPPGTILSKDVGISWMVVEHVENDHEFVRNCLTQIRKGGLFFFAVPARMDLWGIEDETCGHFRRYERSALSELLESSGLSDVNVISCNVPTSNVLMGFSNWLIKNGSEEKSVLTSAKEEQTKRSGIREIPWKTVFPVWIKLLLNPVTMFPLIAIQRIFYNTDLGTVIIGYGHKA